ncbi:MAG: hypothetical protein AAFU61_17805, partial [Pseudomonadota bacterium]
GSSGAASGTSSTDSPRQELTHAERMALFASYLTFGRAEHGRPGLAPAPLSAVSTSVPATSRSPSSPSSSAAAAALAISQSLEELEDFDAAVMPRGPAAGADLPRGGPLGLRHHAYGAGAQQHALWRAPPSSTGATVASVSEFGAGEEKDGLGEDFASLMAGGGGEEGGSSVGAYDRDDDLRGGGVPDVLQEESE